MIPKVSVIIPAYNRAAVLPRAIKSVLAQTCQDFEIIIVDDCSTDGTSKAVSSFSDGRIRYIRHEHNKGGGASRNTGIRAAVGEFVAFLDSDDEWLPSKLEKQLRLFSDAKVGVVYCGFVYLKSEHEKGQEALHKLPKDPHQEIIVLNFIGPTSVVVIRKALLQKTGGFDEQMPSCQDWDLYLSLSSICQFGCVEEFLVNYYIDRKGKGQISTNSAAVAAGHRKLDEKYRLQIAQLPRAKKVQRIDYLLAINLGMADFSGMALARDGFVLSLNPKYLFIITKIIVKSFARKLGLK